MKRLSVTSRAIRAGCYACHGTEAHWTAPNAQGLAARHHDLTGHPTWCDIETAVRYGTRLRDPRQTDIEGSIAAAGPGGRPDAAPHPVHDAPAVPAAGVSAPEGRSSSSALAAAKPEHAHA